MNWQTARRPSLNSMRYLTVLLFLIFLLLGPLAPNAQAAPQKRRAGKSSSLSSVRKEQKYNLKPNVYSPKRHRPLVAKKKRWWRKN